MRPARSFLYVVILFASIAGISYLLPGQVAFLNTINSFFSKSKADTLNRPYTELTPEEGFKDDPVLIPVDSSGLFTIDYLAPVLDSLMNPGEQFRVLYYGDSQIEGDRISGFVRNEFRKIGRGTGPGLFLPLMPVMITQNVSIHSSSNWKRYNYISLTNKEISHNRFGPLLAICRYMPEGTISESLTEATIRIKPTYQTDSSCAIYDQLRVFYRCTEGLVSMHVESNNGIENNDTLYKGNGMHEISIDLNGSSEIEITFSGYTSPDIYGISIESKTGVIVDNVPLRGSAGLEFTMIDYQNLKEGFQFLKPDLIVLQYGLNIVRNVREDYSYYKRGLIRQINLLKEVVPNARILLVGVTDMADITGDSITLFDNISSIAEAQSQAARETEVGFWNAYSAMGGNASISRWRERRLVQTDYIHLTYPGADTMAMMLINDLFAGPLGFIDHPESLSDDTSGMDLQRMAGASENDIVVDPAGYWGRVEDRHTMMGQLFEYDEKRPMIFTTLAFWIFFLVLLAFYSIVYKRPVIRNIYLLIVSLFFYFKTGGLFLILLFVVTMVNYYCGLGIASSGKSLRRRSLLALGVASNLLILIYFKYSAFFIGLINDLFDMSVPIKDYIALLSNNLLGSGFDIDKIILPVGISFFLFQGISYIVDVYRENVKPVRNIIDFGFYISFFPQLVAGPIVRASEFIPQLAAPYKLTKRESGHATFLVCKGLIKKIIISDFIAINFIDRVFDMPSAFSGFENLMAIYGYGLQIYCDFSGYTDIAIGLALVLGFRIPVNFNSPYKAHNLSDFWRRWHISLSRWLKDYLYIPLGGNRKGGARTGINLMVTMLLGGLWHGASARFVLWGGLHGFGLVFNKFIGKLWNDRKDKSWVMRLVSGFITFNFVSFCWIFFRSTDMNSALVMLSQIFYNFSPGDYYGLLTTYSTVFLLMLMGYLIHFLPEGIKESYRGLFVRFPVVIQLVIVLLIAVLLFSVSKSGVMPFIYFRF